MIGIRVDCARKCTRLFLASPHSHKTRHDAAAADDDDDATNADVVDDPNDDEHIDDVDYGLHGKE